MDNKQNTNVSPVAAGITGFILGVMGTAAVVLADKNTRTKMTKKANDMKGSLEKWSKDALTDMQTAGEDMKKKTSEKVEEL